MFTIEYAKGVAEDLKNIRAYERVQILDGIDKQLMHELLSKIEIGKKLFVLGFVLF